MNQGGWIIMTKRLNELWQTLKLVSDCPQLPPDQEGIINPILEQEISARQSRRIKYLLQRSGIKRVKQIHDFDWKFNPKIPREKIMEIFNSDWITNAGNIIFVGPAGVGKSHLASAFCYQAISHGISTAYISCFDLVKRLKTSRNKYNLLQYYAAIKVFCLDELGYVFPNQEEANDIFQIISRRSELLPTIITTNLIPSQWGKIFEAGTATAMLDRLTYSGNFITCEGRSYRSAK